MTAQIDTPSPSRLKPWIIPAVIGAVLLLAAALARPNLNPILQASLAIKVHLTVALAAFGLGTVMMNSRKGARFHRIAGWTWVGLILAVAVTSLFVRVLNPGHWSFIHLSAVYTVVLTPLAVLAARRHKVTTHRVLMSILFYGFVVGAGLLTFIPGRVLGNALFGH